MIKTNQRRTGAKVIRTVIVSKTAWSSVLVVVCASVFVFAMNSLPPSRLGSAALFLGGPLSLVAAIFTARAPRHRIATFLLALIVFAYALFWWIIFLDGCHDQGPCEDPLIAQLPSYFVLFCILAGPVAAGIYLFRRPSADRAVEPRR
jgi:hypothetical protein